jgi:SPP1 family predicted phage head-tail adaptor
MSLLKTKAEVMKDVGKTLRRKIELYKLEIVEDDIGAQYPEWVHWKTLRAERSDLWGQEYYAAKSAGEENTLVFTVRYVPFIDKINTVEYQVKFEGKYYDIKHIDYLQDGGQWVKIKALERGERGGGENG